MTVQLWNVRYVACGTILNVKELPRLNMSTSREGQKRNQLSKLHWYCLICDRMAVNFMKTMANLHTKHQLLVDKVDNLEEEIKSKVDKEEVDQLKKEIKSMREGQKQATGAMEEN